MQKALSMLTEAGDAVLAGGPLWADLRWRFDERWAIPPPIRPSLAERLVRLFSFAGDTVLDPFVGVGSTSVAALHNGRSSIGNEIEPEYLTIAAKKLGAAIAKKRMVGAIHAQVHLFNVADGVPR